MFLKIILSIYTISILLAVKPVYAFDKNRSFLCSDNNFVYKGITCCLETISAQSCQHLIDTKIPIDLLEVIKTVQQKVNDNAYPYMSVPNCFWAAGAFNNQAHRKTPHPLSIPTFQQYLTANYEQLTDNTVLNFGDLIVFESESEHYHDMALESIIVRVYQHAAIYLGDNFIFQKENIATGVFTISDLDYALNKYEEAFNESESSSYGRMNKVFFRKD